MNTIQQKTTEERIKDREEIKSAKANYVFSQDATDVSISQIVKNKTFNCGSFYLNILPR